MKVVCFLIALISVGAVGLVVGFFNPFGMGPPAKVRHDYVIARKHSPWSELARIAGDLFVGFIVMCVVAYIVSVFVYFWIYGGQ
jgi:hypothetical protein